MKIEASQIRTVDIKSTSRSVPIPEYQVIGGSLEELEECKNRIQKLEKKLTSCPVWLTVEQNRLKKKIEQEETKMLKIASQLAAERIETREG